MFAYTKTLFDSAILVFEHAIDEMLDLRSALYYTSRAIVLACKDLKLGR